MKIHCTGKYKLLNKLTYLLMLVLTSCAGSHDETKPLTLRDTITVKDYNLIIAPDLSNRIDFNVHPKPLHDTVLVNGIINDINSILTLQNRRVGQKDIYRLDFINPGILNNNWIDVDACKIDFSQFSNVHENAEYKRNQLSGDQKVFKEEVQKLYGHAINDLAGADIWNYFNQTISNQVKIIAPETRVEGEIVVSRELRNVVILFTDGYIENVNNNKGYQLTEKQVDDLRIRFHASKSNDLQAFIGTQPTYAIAKTTQSLKDLDVVVFEMVDRSLNPQGVAAKHPTDFEIMSIIWKNWLKESGCRHVEIFKAVADKNVMLERLKNFLKVI